MLLKIAHVLQNFLRPRVGVVGVRRREMGEDPGSVDAFPEKGVVRKFIELAPGNLLGQEIIDPALAHDLGKRCRVTEDIGNPDVARFIAELLLEKPLAVEDLAHQRFARGEVAIGLDPHGTNRLPLTATHRFFDPLIDVRVMGLHPGILLGLRAAEDVLRILLHIIQRGGKRAGAFTDRLA